MKKGTIHIELEGEKISLEVRNMGFVTQMEVMLNTLRDMINYATKDDFVKNEIAKVFAKNLEEIFKGKSEEKDDQKRTSPRLC